MSVKSLRLCLAATIALGVAAAPVPALAQSSLNPELARRSQETQTKLRKVDLLLHIMPLALRRDQYRDILPVIERARSRMRKVLENEDKKIVELEAKLDAALKAANEEGVYPKRDLVVECYGVTTTLTKIRLVEREIIAGDVVTELNKILDAGQKKVAANSLEPKLLDPSVKIDEADESAKIRFYARWILLDPLAYDILVDLQKKAQG